MALTNENKPPLSILLCAPRGFCAGVVRAIQIVEKALAQYGAPVYVRHEIVHNKFVVDELKAKGAIFVDELDEIPPTDAPIIFSAHGVPKTITASANNRNMFVIDATCPLVIKVHREAEIHWKKGRHVILIGHAGHPEVIGTMGQLPEGAVTLVESLEDVAALQLDDHNTLAFVTQTTLSIDDTREMIEALQQRFPHIQAPHKQDICYATTNRQEAVKQVAPLVDAMIVIGSPNSSNSQRLKEVALREGCPKASLLLRASDIHWPDFKGITKLGITAGASAPDILVEEIIAAFSKRFHVTTSIHTLSEENVYFPLPKLLRDGEENPTC